MTKVTIHVSPTDIRLGGRGCTGDPLFRAADRVIPGLKAVTYSAMFAGPAPVRIPLPPEATALAEAIDRREAVSPLRFVVMVPDELLAGRRAA